MATRSSSDARGLRVTRIAERDLPERAGAVLRRPAARLQATVAGLGRGLGPPWAQDQKLAALLAWAVLATPRPSR